jgi:hypothetical protein
LFKKSAEILRVPLLHGEDSLEPPASRWIIIARISDHLAIAVDGDPLGDGVFLILRVAPTEETLRREVRCTAHLHDSLCNLIRVNLFILCVLE